ncbi:MAG: PEP-CTERM sorting domain-containing protein, partial [Methylococcales bacterium]|nr:PEP-CTERM sorting domain-containing protein [Methylococcales bacterium]
QNSIVTHYSSMLVLVNDRQKEALKKAEAGGDRFEREVEQGKAPINPFAIPSVPEPEEWALMIIAGILLLLAYRKRCNTENLNAMR